jgi:hypothetical protein
MTYFVWSSVEIFVSCCSKLFDFYGLTGIHLGKSLQFGVLDEGKFLKQIDESD